MIATNEAILASLRNLEDLFCQAHTGDIRDRYQALRITPKYTDHARRGWRQLQNLMRIAIQAKANELRARR